MFKFGLTATTRWCTRPSVIRPLRMLSTKLPSEDESHRWGISKWATKKLDRLQTSILTAGQTLNDITGYSSIEKIRTEIVAKEEELVQCREDLRRAKEQYSRAISQRSNSQKEVNELLQRKHNWNPDDVQRVTELYKDEYKDQQAEQTAEQLANQKDSEFEDRRLEIAKLISARYHEEQIWSDKIRRASTYGTWVLMGFNVLLFIVVQLGLEPWKRRRLVGSFEEKVKSALETQTQTIEAAQPIDTANEVKAEVEEDEKLVWSTLPRRIVTSVETSAPLSVNIVEYASTAATTAVLGMAIGSLITLAFR